MIQELKAYLWKDRVTALCVFAVILLNVGIWIFLLNFIRDPNEFRVLRYSAYFGITDFGPARELYTIPFIGTVIGVTNIVLAFFLHTRERNLSRIIAVGTVFVELLTTVSLIAILLQRVPQ